LRPSTSGPAGFGPAPAASAMSLQPPLHAANRGLRDRLAGVADRLLASQKFQRWASAFPLTRHVARARTRALFDLVAGFVYSQVLFACVQVRLFDLLFDGPKSLAVIATATDLSPDAALRLLRAAISLRLVRERGGARYGLGPLGAAMVGNPAITAMVEHHAMLYADLRDPVALLRGETTDTALGRYWPYAAHSAGHAADQAAPADSHVAAYSALMAASQALIAADVIEAAGLDRHRCLLDVGGGDGVFVAEVATHVPALKLMLFDLPAVAARAARRLAPLGDRITIRGGDFLTGALPTGADVISLVRVLHDHDDPRALTILRAVRAALPPGGRLLLAEPMSGTAGAEPVGDAYFGFYLLAMGSGRPRTAAEIIQFLTEAGFARARPIATRRPLLTCLIEAWAPNSP